MVGTAVIVDVTLRRLLFFRCPFSRLQIVLRQLAVVAVVAVSRRLTSRRGLIASAAAFYDYVVARLPPHSPAVVPL